MTIRNIAERLGLSAATVSRVLNDRTSDLISDETRRRVREEAERVGYRPNAAARALVTGRTNVVSLWLHNRFSFSAFVAQVVHSVMAQVRGTAVELLLEYIEDPDPHTPRAPSGRWPVDGILAHEAPQFVQAYRAQHNSRGVPVVGMGCWFDPTTDHVAMRLDEGVRQAMRHLLSISPREVVYLVNHGSDTPGEPRYDVYHGMMRDAGVAPKTLLCREQTRASARQAVTDHLSQGRSPAAIFCHNDDLAIGAYRALVQRGIRVPDDVALVGCDGIEDTEYLPCALTTVVQPIGHMCATAWDLLQRRIANPSAPQQTAVVEAHLHIRESSRAS